MNDEEKITGGCLCGAVRYESTEPPIYVGYCHCRICQKAYGNLFGVFAAFPAAALKFTQVSPKYYRSSKHAQRGFCSECGTPISFVYEDDPEPGVLLGTLDNPGAWPPTPDHGHTGIESKVSWLEIHDGLPQTTTSDAPGYLPSELRLSTAVTSGENERKKRD